jgi:Tol biopolymer transport system component/DNA-binding winged helix-turn-helix (wHTH) protein
MTRISDVAVDPSVEPPAAQRGYTFDGFQLDLLRMGVWRDEAPVPLEPKTLDLLCYLVVHRDRLITKEELLDAVWKDTFVTPNALTRAIAQLRKALGDEVGHPRLIETVAKRGYRFIAPVSPVSPVSTATAVAPLMTAAIAAPARAMPRAITWTTVVVVVLLMLAAGVVSWVAASLSTPGGRATLEITPLTSSGDVIDSNISPDGKYVALVRSTPGQQSLWIRQLRGANPLELVPAAPVSYYGLAFAPDSASIYYVVRGPEPLAFPAGMLFQIPALGGTPRRLGTPFDHYAAVSPDGQRLASLRANVPAPGESALLIAKADGTSAHPLMIARPPEILSPGFFVAPSWSPAGDRLAATIRNTDTGVARLLTVDVATGRVRPFDRTFMLATFTSWLPDGSGIVFVAAEKGEPAIESGSHLWFQPLPDGPPRRITTGLVEYRNVSVSADASALVSVGSVYHASMWTVPIDGSGTLQKIPSLKEDGFAGLAWMGPGPDSLVFTSLDGGTGQIWTMKTDGTGRRQITTEGSNLWPRPTRDGRTIFVASRRDGGSGIWRIDRDGTGARLLARADQPADLVLTPDEQWVVYSSHADGVDSTWKIPAAGGEPVVLVPGLTRAASSPDGRTIAGVWQGTANVTPSLAIFSVSGGAPLKIFAGPFTAMKTGGVWWSRDGLALLYTSAERANVWRQDVSGGAPIRLTDFADGVTIRGDVSPDGRTLLAFRGDQLRDAFLIKGFR